MRIPFLAALFAGFVSVAQIHLCAQGGPPPGGGPVAQIEVADVKFNSARAEGGGDVWMETLVDLDVKPGGKPVTGEFLNRVRVTLNLGLEATNAKGEKLKAFYKASAEMIAVEGGKAQVRFYLPPEIVKRDKLRGDAEFFCVDLEVAGEPQPMTAAKVSKNLAKPELVSSFKSKIGSDAAINDGVLMPQYLTPFATDGRRPSPTFLRREAQR